MGKKLMKFYELIKLEAGIQGQMRMAMKTALSSIQAEKAPDSPENIQKFKSVYKELTGKDAPII
jgi:hypothetical protein